MDDSGGDGDGDGSVDQKESKRSSSPTPFLMASEEHDRQLAMTSLSALNSTVSKHIKVDSHFMHYLHEFQRKRVRIARNDRLLDDGNDGNDSDHEHGEDYMLLSNPNNKDTKRLKFGLKEEERENIREKEREAEDAAIQNERRSQQENQNISSVKTRNPITSPPPTIKKPHLPRLNRQIEFHSSITPEDGHNMTRVARMLLRILHQYNITSMIDIPCTSHSHWMPWVLARISARSFKYTCVDSKSTDEVEESLHSDLSVVSVKFMPHVSFWTGNVAENLPQADLVFSWDGLTKLSVKDANNFIDRIVNGKKHKFLFMASLPNVEQNDDNNQGVNVRKKPFEFKRPDRIFKELVVGGGKKGEKEKQLYFYVIDKLRKSWGQPNR